MKQLILTAALLISIAYGQSFILSDGSPYDCGVYKTRVDTSDWVTVDTLNKDFKKGRVRDWVYDKWRNEQSPNYTLLIWRPCGGSTSREYQFRICKITGIRQKKTITHSSWYEKEETEYEKTINKFMPKITTDTVRFIQTGIGWPSQGVIGGNPAFIIGGLSNPDNRFYPGNAR